MDIAFYKEQLEAKEDMLARTTKYLTDIRLDLQEKNRELDEAYRDIFGSIRFAELIQRSLLPDISILRIFFQEAAYSVMQQIGIGGDSVFIKNTSQGIVFGLTDSTGHGIPAALLSISGSLMLNELTTSIEIERPNDLVKLLNYQLHNTFNSNQHSIAHMEGTVCYYSTKKRKLSYCSANGKAILFNKQGELKELVAGKYSIGENLNNEFDNFELDIKHDDRLILFSDGLTDQFGGDKNKKFSRARLKQLILMHCDKPVNELKQIITEEHIHWKGANQQTDDVSFLIVEF